jgi:excinuclease ABC subunit C
MLPERPCEPDRLRADVRASCANRPGIYWMVGPGDEVLYVGKSKQVRTRLLSYFRAPSNEKAAQIIAHTHRIGWEYVPSEFAAVVLELRSIQQWRPPFNVEHKRDRGFCFIKLTREAAPRLALVREVRPDGAQYFGPFRGTERVRATLREVSDLLELRDCRSGTPMRFADQLDIFGLEQHPLCLRADVKKCLGPCAGRCTRSEYLAQVELARRFLDGDADTPLRLLQQRMHSASERLNFEYAAQLRDRSQRLGDAAAELVALRGVIESLSFVYRVEGRDGDDRVYIIRRGCIREERPAPRTAEEQARLQAEAHRILTRPEHHGGTVQPTQVAEILLLARWFRLHPGERERCWTPHSARAVALPL